MTRIIEKVKVLSVVLVYVMIGSLTSGQTLKVLPLGNSITQGWMGSSLPVNQRVSYRQELFDLLLQAGYNFDFVGSEHAGSTYISDDDHAGWPGIRDNEVADIMETGTTAAYGAQATQAYLFDYPADLILLHIGTNDVTGGDLDGSESVERILDAIDDYETSTGNEVLVLLAKIISRSGSNCTSYPNITTYNNSVVTMAQDRIDDDDDKIIIVDMQCGAGIDYTDEMYDDWHPDETGYEKMGQEWFDIINSINSKPVIATIPNQPINEGEVFNPIQLDSYISDTETNDEDMNWCYIQEAGSELDVNIDAGRNVTITIPDFYWNGSECIRFYAFDDGEYIEELKKSSDTIEVVFTVLPVNNPPVIDSLVTPLTVNEDDTLEITLDDLAVTDPDDNYPADHSLTISAGSHYTLDENMVIPDPDYNGPLSIPVVVKDDEELESDVFYADITVAPVNDPPVLNEPENLSATVDELYNESVEVIDLDIEDIPALSVIQAPGWLEVNTTTRILSGTPAEGDVGNNQVILEVSDGFASTDKEFHIVVSPSIDIGEVIHTTDIFIYPNPAKEHITVAFNNEVKQCEFSVHSTSGNIVYTNTFYHKKELRFHLADLHIDTGIYIVNIRINDNELLHFKLAVNY